MLFTLLFFIFITIHNILTQTMLTEASINFWHREKDVTENIVKLGTKSNIQSTYRCK